MLREFLLLALESLRAALARVRAYSAWRLRMCVRPAIILAARKTTKCQRDCGAAERSFAYARANALIEVG